MNFLVKKSNFALQFLKTPAHNGPSSRPLYSRFPLPLPPIPHPLPPIPHPLSPYPRPPPVHPLLIEPTGPCSAVGNVSGNRCESDRRSRRREFPARSHTFVEIDHEIISMVILLPSAVSFKKDCCRIQAKVCARSTG